ncbi:modifier of mdg4 [Condylostylus longicornis]|uniref:modifier of mdg4 n=1 Tax=Condylostylus longicornis TaxID=2530218 RepID=UPI00244DFC33|nr:modifier of mdg4 [Condylostylus longicornis]XP_055385263.1 modifier of mdg4 [Condylostylus longicornis]XP_055385264.1 modifier of mdg4 [Condylostylus longicornis]
MSAAIVAENYHLKWGSHSMHLNMSVAELYKHDRFADVMLLSSHPDCLGGPGVPAHKVILSASSKFFATVFELTPHIPPQNGLMYLVLPPSLSRRAIQVLVQYMYSGESTVSNDILKEVLSGGELLKIRGLYRGKSTDSNKNFGLTTPINPEILSSTNHSTERDISPFSNLKTAEGSVLNIRQYSRIAQRTKSVSDAIPDKQFNLSVNKEIAIDPDPRTTSAISSKSDNLEKSSQKFDTPLILSVTTDFSSKNSIERRKPSIGSNFSDCLLQIKEEPNDSDSEQSQSITRNFTESLDSGSKIENTEAQRIGTFLEDESSKDDIAVENCDMELQNIIESNEENSASYFSDYCDKKITPSNEKSSKSEQKQVSDLDDSIPEKKQKIQAESTKNKKKSLSNNTQKRIGKFKYGLKCDICHIAFQFPETWVRHMQALHTEVELAINNEKLKNARPTSAIAHEYLDKISKSCQYCDISFNSYKEMIAHTKKEHFRKNCAL